MQTLKGGVEFWLSSCVRCFGDHTYLCPSLQPPALHPLQRCIDWNRDVLKKELGLMEEDIIDLPALFKLDKQGKAVPYFPNMVRGVPAPWVLSKTQLSSQDESLICPQKSPILTPAWKEKISSARLR